MLLGRRWAARTLVGALSAVALAVGLGAAPAAAATSVEVDVPVEAPTRGLVMGTYEASAPQSAEVVHVVLPPSAAGLDPLSELDSASVQPASSIDGPVTSEGVTPTATGVDLHVPTVRRALRLSAESTRSLRLHVHLHRGETDVVRYDAGIELAFTADLGTEATITLVDDETAFVHTNRSWTLPTVTVEDGQDLVVRAPAGFWTDRRTIKVTAVETWSDPRYHQANLTPAISDDGSTLTVPVASTGHGRHAIAVTQDLGNSGNQVVTVPVVGPPTEVELYVTSVYQDLFGRDPDPTGLAGWADALERGTPYGAVADGITYSDEFRLGLIADSYQQLLQRDPDTAGLYSWLAAMQGGMHIQQMETGFIASPEYYSRAGGTDPGFLAAMYRDVLGRTPTPSEVSGWLPVIASKGRIDVARQFLYSTEYLTHVVDGYYQWLLGRGIDPTGARDWVRAIQQGVRSEAIIAGIISSQEYRNNVGR